MKRPFAWLAALFTTLVVAAPILSCTALGMPRESCPDRPRRPRVAVVHDDPFGQTWLAPRCDRDDPDCGPEPFGHVCLEATDYVPRVRRVIRSLPRPWTQSDCAYDGECSNSGCGYACVSSRVPEQAFLCLGLPEVEEALQGHYCGCVDGLCQWFTQ